ncbi:pyridoxal phosphate-dependent decarboxylase family protein [Actinacidiphila sp. bgisy167]|uniref:pyridoxal phosphate-dependent decarboxylase family protein n=1 Tax=Actinacidiphila sp. bgisy167 TaxID=3413797 RepID=UPI003D747D62
MPPHLAGGSEGPDRLRPLVEVVLDALAAGAAARKGPLPAGGPGAVARRVGHVLGKVLPEDGSGAAEALCALVSVVAEGAADPADPLCAAHLHCPPLGEAVAADLAASALNPSMDSWDQAPAATALETEVTRALARLVHPDAVAPDALVTTGGTESNQIALLLAREGAPDVRVVAGANAHHSVPRAAWLLGMRPPVLVDTPRGLLDPERVRAVLAADDRPALLVATAGTTDTGDIDPLPELARTAREHGARLHIDAAYGGPLLFSDREAPRLAGLREADTVTLDLHKLGWQPVAAGVLAVREAALLHPLEHRADYLNAADDTEAGLPDLLGRSLRTSRRPDVLKIAVTLRALGRRGLGGLVEAVCDRARQLAELVKRHPALTLRARPAISTVLFRPIGAGDEEVAVLRRRLMLDGRAVLGRARADGRLWLKVTLLNPATTQEDLQALLTLVCTTHQEGSTPR